LFGLIVGFAPANCNQDKASIRAWQQKLHLFFTFLQVIHFQQLRRVRIKLNPFIQIQSLIETLFPPITHLMLAFKAGHTLFGID